MKVQFFPSTKKSLLKIYMERITNVLSHIPRYLGLSRGHKTIPEIIDSFNTFDILLFQGQDYWFSYIVEYATWSDFSHIGIVLKSPTWLDPSLTGTYLLESGSEPTPDVVSHKMIFGVQLTDLEKLFERYNGKIFHRSLESMPIRENPDYYREKMQQVYQLIKNKPYDDSPLDLIRSDLHARLGNCRRINTFFCSALTGFVYTQLGLVPADTKWDLLTPKDFDVGREVDKKMKWQAMGYLRERARVL